MSRVIILKYLHVGLPDAALNEGPEAYFEAHAAMGKRRITG